MRLDLGVDPNKSTGLVGRLGHLKSSRVDSAWRRRPAVKCEWKSDFMDRLLRVD